jgi:Zn-dependent alcohol dehydrogenase
VWKGTAFGGARGRTDVPRIVDWYMEGKIEIDPMITHTLALADIYRGFDLMHKGESAASSCIEHLGVRLERACGHPSRRVAARRSSG